MQNAGKLDRALLDSRVGVVEALLYVLENILDVSNGFGAKLLNGSTDPDQCLRINLEPNEYNLNDKL